MLVEASQHSQQCFAATQIAPLPHPCRHLEPTALLAGLHLMRQWLHMLRTTLPRPPFQTVSTDMHQRCMPHPLQGGERGVLGA